MSGRPARSTLCLRRAASLRPACAHTSTHTAPLKLVLSDEAPCTRGMLCILALIARVQPRWQASQRATRSSAARAVDPSHALPAEGPALRRAACLQSKAAQSLPAPMMPFVLLGVPRSHSISSAALSSCQQAGVLSTRSRWLSCLLNTYCKKCCSDLCST